jgi:hypothetical protein
MTRIVYFTLAQAEALFAKPTAEPVSEYQRERLAQRDNYERLKQERRAREASNQST